MKQRRSVCLSPSTTIDRNLTCWQSKGQLGFFELLRQLSSLTELMSEPWRLGRKCQEPGIGDERIRNCCEGSKGSLSTKGAQQQGWSLSQWQKRVTLFGCSQLQVSCKMLSSDEQTKLLLFILLLKSVFFFFGGGGGSWHLH